MRLVLTSALLLLKLSAGGCEKGKPITMKLLPAAEVGPEATAAKGPSGGPAIEVVGNDATDTFAVAMCNDPAISLHDRIDHGRMIQYLVRGRVKSAGVEGGAALELLSEFTRMNVEHAYRDQLGLDGTGEWGSFEIGLPTQSGMLLKRLTLSVVLPAGGRLTLAEPLLVVPRNVSNAWWTDRQAGWIGGTVGTLFGILGGLIGVSAAWGKSRGLTVSMCGVGLATSTLSLIAGIVALFAGQPWHVYYFLLLLGVVGIGALGLNLWAFLRRLQADELRRMTAADVI